MNAQIQVILVTGAAGGLGAALSEACAEAGFHTVLLDKDQSGLEQLYDRIVGAGWMEPVLHPMDLAAAGPDEIDQLLAAVEREFGRLDAIVHCAARFEGLTPLEHVAPQEWLHHVQVNLNAAWLLSARSLPLLRQSPRGRLYFLLEDMKRVGRALWGPYGASKHALHALTGQLAEECQSTNIQVLGIDPGPMRTALRAKAYLAEHPGSQSPPGVAAGEILNLLTGARVPSGTFVKLGSADVDG